MLMTQQCRDGSYRLFRYCLFIILVSLTTTLSAHNDHPLGKQEHDWHPDPAIVRTLSLNFDAHAGHFIVAWKPPGGVQKIEGHECLVGPYFLFDVDDSVAFDIDAKVTVDLLFDRNTTSGFYISYDHAIKPTAKKIVFDEKSSERWHRVSVELERARFANRKYEGTDFSIAALQSTHPRESLTDTALTLCDLRIRIESEEKAQPGKGRLELNVVNEKGQADTVRAGLYDGEGRAPLVDESALTVLRYAEKTKELSLLDSNVFWPGKGRFVFYLNSNYETELPEGTYDLIISKGPEYRIIQRKIQIESNQTTQVQLKLERWIDMPSTGWYSGDGHIHIGRVDSSENEMILGFTRAEDIHLSNLLQMSNVATWHFPQYAFGLAGQFRSGQHALAPGQESPRTGHLGHTIGLNGRAFHWPGDDYYLYYKTADRIHEDGGLFGYAHVALADVFNLDRGLALDMPLGRVDFLEVLQSGLLNTKHLYNFLNLGFKLLPAAGSDYPYIHLAGTERTYVQVSGEFTPQVWFEAWPEKRSFVSNGPVLSFTVNGNSQSNQVDITKGENIEIIALSRVNPDLDKIKSLELIVQGEVVATSSVQGPNGIALKHFLKPESSTWFALRTHGERGAVAHTAAVYVLVDGDQRFWKQEAVEKISQGYIDALEILRKSRPELHDDFELFNTENSILSKWDAAKPALDEQISRAIQTYRGLIEAAR